MSDPKHPDLDRPTYLFILNRAKAIAAELVARVSLIADGLDKDDQHPVLGELALAEIQMQHLRAIVRLLAT